MEALGNDGALAGNSATVFSRRRSLKCVPAYHSGAHQPSRAAEQTQAHGARRQAPVDVLSECCTPVRPAGLCTAAVTLHHADPLRIARAGQGKDALTFRLLCICAGHQRNHHQNCQRGRSAAHSRVRSHARRLCCPGPFAAAAGLLQAPARSLALSSFRHGCAPLMDTGGADAGRQIRGARVSWAWGEDVLAARPCYTSVRQPAVPVFCERLSRPAIGSTSMQQGAREELHETRLYSLGFKP